MSQEMAEKLFRGDNQEMGEKDGGKRRLKICWYLLTSVEGGSEGFCCLIYVNIVENAWEDHHSNPWEWPG